MFFSFSPFGSRDGSLAGMVLFLRCRDLLPCLIALNQLANADGIALTMPMAGDWLGAPGRINADFRPDDPSLDFDRGDLVYGDALLRPAEQAGFHPADMQRVDHDPRGKEVIAARPAAGGKA